MYKTNHARSPKTNQTALKPLPYPDARIPRDAPDAQPCLKKSHAKKFLKLVQNSNDPYIRGFNNIVGKGIDAVREWYVTEGAAIRAGETAAMAKAGAGTVRYAKYGGKVVKVLLVGSFIYLATENGIQAATEETVRDLIFADELLAGGEWLVNKTENFFDPVSLESRCCRAGLDPDDL